jgi:quercetin dioxygenase-like cupin family protein
MRKLAIGAAIVAGVSILMIAATAFATPSVDFTTVQISKGQFGEIDVKTNNAKPNQVKLKTKGESDVYVVENTVKPGGSSGWHTHPGPSLITVKAGTATFYDGDDPTCSPHSYPAGSGVIDPGDGHVHILRNEGNVDLVTVTVQILPVGAPRRIDAPSPGNCGF